MRVTTTHYAWGAGRPRLIFTVDAAQWDGVAPKIYDLTADKVTIGSIDGSCTGVKNVKDGVIGATVMQFPAKMASMGVEAVVKYAKDGTKPTGNTDTKD